MARRVSRGIDVVHRVLPDWKPRVVVEVPASAAALNRSLGVPPGTYDSIAAVTATADGSSRRDAPVHVYVNPEVTAGLRRAGAQVVMSHELVHVATDAATSPVEPWLLEGFADYVALRDVELPDATTLGPCDRAGAARRPAGPAAWTRLSSTRVPRTCRRSTSRRGWPAGSSPSGWGSMAWCRFTERGRESGREQAVRLQSSRVVGERAPSTWRERAEGLGTVTGTLSPRTSRWCMRHWPRAIARSTIGGTSYTRTIEGDR